MALQEEMDAMRIEWRAQAQRLVEISELTKQLLLERLQRITEPGRITQRTGAHQGRTDSPQSPLEQLSEKERQILNLLLARGALTYEEMARELNIRPAYAKNLVNRISRKATVLSKEKAENRNVVSVEAGFRQGLLSQNASNPSKDAP
jgi:DNA-binding CsgD family transcriptional regulator